MYKVFVKNTKNLRNTFTKEFSSSLIPRWDRKNNPEPWNKMEPNQQYKVWAFLHIMLKFTPPILMCIDDLVPFFILLYMACWLDLMNRPISVEPYLFSYLASNIAALILIMYIYFPVCVCVFVSSFSQLTWITPSWRRTGLISKSQCFCTSVSDIVVSVRSLCTFCQIYMALNEVWITVCLTHSVSSFPVWRREGSYIYQWLYK